MNQVDRYKISTKKKIDTFVLFRKNYKVIMLSLLFSIILCIGLPAIFLGSRVFEFYSGYIHLFILPNFIPFQEMKSSLFLTVDGFIVYLFPKIHGGIFLKLFSASLTMLPIVIVELYNIIKKEFISSSGMFNLYLLAILLISPKSQIHYLIYMFPAISCFTLRMLFDKKWFSRSKILILGVYFVLFFWGTLDTYGPGWFLSIISLYSITIWALASGKNGLRIRTGTI